MRRDSRVVALDSYLLSTSFLIASESSTQAALSLEIDWVLSDKAR